MDSFYPEITKKELNQQKLTNEASIRMLTNFDFHTKSADLILESDKEVGILNSRSDRHD